MGARKKVIKFDDATKEQLLDLYKKRKISLEGNILKLVDYGDDIEFAEYVEDAIKRDKEKQKKRLEITKGVQLQNTQLTESQKENERMNRQLTKALEEAEKSKEEAINSRNEAIDAKNEAESARNEALESRLEAIEAKDEAEKAKEVALNDLDVLQKKTQFELMGTIVKVALWIIGFVGISVTTMYGVAIYTGAETEIIGSTWTSMMGMLLTNSFSIVGTIMGIKHAMRKNES